GVLSVAAQNATSDWKSEAKKAGLTPEEMTRLESEKVLVSKEEVNQSFSAYLSGKLPMFVTSDAVLNAYHVLFEQTLRKQELVNADRLHSILKVLWPALPRVAEHYDGDRELIQSAINRAQFVIGLALKLAGGELPGVSPELLQKVNDEAVKIEKAEGQYKP